MGNFITKPFESSTDVPSKIDPDNPHIKRIIKAREEMDGWDRIKMVFSKNEFGDITPELQRCIDATLIAMFVGAIMGGFGRSRIAYMDFFRQNVHTPFESPLQAKRALQDKVVLGMGSGAFRIGWRLSAFTGMYMTTSTVIAAYRGKIGIVDQVGGAGMAGFLYKLRDGPKAAVSGTIFGSLLGLLAGTITVIAVKMLGMDLQSANLYYYHRLGMKRENEHQKLLSQRQTLSMNNLEKFHENLYAATEPEKSKSETQSLSLPKNLGQLEVQEKKQAPSAQATATS